MTPATPEDVPAYRTRPEWADSTTAANHPWPKIALASLMSELSERCYYAGWLIGIEEVLWGVAAELRDYDRGQDTVLEIEVQWLRALAVAAGGWIEWRDGDGLNLDGCDGRGPRFVAWKTTPQGGPVADEQTPATDTARKVLDVLRELVLSGDEQLKNVYNIDPDDEVCPLDAALKAWRGAGMPGVGGS